MGLFYELDARTRVAVVNGDDDYECNINNKPTLADVSMIIVVIIIIMTDRDDEKYPLAGKLSRRAHTAIICALTLSSSEVYLFTLDFSDAMNFESGTLVVSTGGGGRANWCRLLRADLREPTERDRANLRARVSAVLL